MNTRMLRILWAGLFLVLGFCAKEAFASEDAPRCRPERYSEEREKMVREQIQARGVKDDSVLRAMRGVARHCFVPREFRDEAYEDHPISIGQGQTISQPYIVALMTELLQVKPSDRVLEIGTGSGYQAAVLSGLVNRVFTVEISARSGGGGRRPAEVSRIREHPGETRRRISRMERACPL